MTLARRWALILAVITMLPFFVPFSSLAQEEDALRAAIRADIMADPRSVEMSPTELDALVEALAAQAEDQGVAGEYLEAQNSFDDVPFEAPVYEVLESVPYNALSLAIGAFFIVLIGVWLFLAIQRKKRREGGSPDKIVS